MSNMEDMVAADAWVAFYFGDYIKKTMGLRPVEHGIYMMLLANYYVQGGGLPADKKRLEGMCNARTRGEKQVLDEILQRFFALVGNTYCNKRADEEIAKRLDISDKRRSAANARHANAHANAHANQVHLDTQSQSQSQKDSISAKRATQLPKDFLPNETNKRIAKDLKLDLEEELRAFKDFHESKGNRYINWHLALNTWMRNSVRWGSKKPDAKGKAPDYGDITENMQKLRERLS